MGQKLLLGGELSTNFGKDNLLLCNKETVTLTSVSTKNKVYGSKSGSVTSLSVASAYTRISTQKQGTQGVLHVTEETIHVPSNAMAFISMKTGIKFKGLINVFGFHVDPGFKGKLVFSAFNASPSPIQICVGDPIFRIWFAELDRTSTPDHLFQGKGRATIDNDLIR